ncbi:hypothetical protein SAMN02745217_04683 [Anaerocolumna xylanovorans DSM 12503]|uniref:Uncharacterized protein n=1 Tax=Anaerocolumna xylanovorans DSM 12503 TaxID=1121345 RepID=A0A1M7YP04_9FIRM|nr:hypothetical protein SAMN02745217_04683 [Anaerocolumna xylanovorans DSM 12503]
MPWLIKSGWKCAIIHKVWTIQEDKDFLIFEVEKDRAILVKAFTKKRI